MGTEEDGKAMTDANHNGRDSAKTKIIVAMAGNGEMTASEIKRKASLLWWEPVWLYLIGLEQDGAVKGRGWWPFRAYRLGH